MINKTHKLLLIAPMRWGKDTMAEILNKHFGLKYESSSVSASRIFLYDILKEKYNYSSIEECFEDRVNHRAEWYDLICEYNKDDKAKLAKEILKESDAYIGMRDGDEIKECIKQGLFDLIVWIDASKRLPPEPLDSFKIDSSYADIIIDNNGTYEEFEARVKRFGSLILDKIEVTTE